MSKNSEWIYNYWHWFRHEHRSYRRMCRKNPTAATLLKANEQFKDSAVKKRCFVLGNGPSLRQVNFELLKDEDVITVNQAARHPDFKILRPRFHFWADPAFFDINPDLPGDRELLKAMQDINTGSHKPACFFPIQQQNFVERFRLSEKLDVHYFYSSPARSLSPKFRRDFDFSTIVPAGYTVIMWGIMMAVYAGYKEIYLLGCDTTSIIVNLKSLLQQNDNEDYGYDISLNEKERLERMVRRQGAQAQAKAFLQTLREYGWLYQYCKRRGISLINCSAITVVDSLPRKNLESVLGYTQKHEQKLPPLPSSPRTIAVVPMKLNNRRLPQKNTKSFTNGKPLCYYILNTLKQVNGIDEIYVYCSNPDIQAFIPEGIRYLRRSESLDQDTTSMNEVLQAFAAEIPADVYVMTHTTAPFISAQSIHRGLVSVLQGEYDSSFAAKKLQDFLWKDGKPFNYTLDNIPRTQDLPPLCEETSGFYIYRREVLTELNRRIGNTPFIVEVGEIESTDIDEAEDFDIADAIYNHLLKGTNGIP